MIVFALEDQTLLLEDDYHRVAAAQLAGRTTVPSASRHESRGTQQLPPLRTSTTLSDAWHRPERPTMSASARSGSDRRANPSGSASPSGDPAVAHVDASRNGAASTVECREAGLP